MRIQAVQVWILGTQNLHLSCSQHLELLTFQSVTFLNFKHAAVHPKTPKVFTPRDYKTQVRSGHHFHLCQSKLWQPQSLSIPSGQTCQMPPVGCCAVYIWMSCDSAGGQKGRRKIPKRKGDREGLRWRHIPTYLPKISIINTRWCGQAQLCITCCAIGLIFQFHSDYAVGFLPVAIVGH